MMFIQNDICNSFIYRLVLNRVPTVVETDVVGDVATDDIIYRQGVITLVEGWKNGSVSTVHLFISKHVFISYNSPIPKALQDLRSVLTYLDQDQILNHLSNIHHTKMYKLARVIV